MSDDWMADGFRDLEGDGRGPIWETNWNIRDSFWNVVEGAQDEARAGVYTGGVNYLMGLAVLPELPAYAAAGIVLGLIKSGTSEVQRVMHAFQDGTYEYVQVSGKNMPLEYLTYKDTGETYSIRVDHVTFQYSTAGSSCRVDISGSNLPDYIAGCLRVNKINGNGGNDIVAGGGGNDFLYGGNDDDELYGGSGADRLSGGAGTDTMYGGAWSDVFVFNRNDSASDFQYGMDHVIGEAFTADKVVLSGNNDRIDKMYDFNTGNAVNFKNDPAIPVRFHENLLDSIVYDEPLDQAFLSWVNNLID